MCVCVCVCHVCTQVLRREFGVDLRILGITTSSQMLLRERGVDLDNWREEFKQHALPADLKAFGDFLAESYIPNRAIVDCTASDTPAEVRDTVGQRGFARCRCKTAVGA